MQNRKGAFLTIYFILCALSFSLVASEELLFEDGEKDFIKSLVRGLVSQTFSDIISDPVTGQQILKDPLYFYTKPLRRRAILDLPFIQLQKHTQENTKRIIPFYDQMDKAVYVGTKTAIGSYADMNQRGLIEALDVLKFLEIEVPEVLPLFKNVQVQERRLGFFYCYRWVWDEWSLGLTVPFLYQEYNFYLSKADREAIQNAQVLKPRKAPEVVEQAPQEQKQQGGGFVSFAQHHLISDKIGMADIRLSFEKELKKTESYTLFGGIDVTLPCDFPLKHALAGAHFNKKRPDPTFDLHADIIDLYDKRSYDQAKQNALDFGLAALDRFSTILLEYPLGNKRHPVFAPFFTLERSYSEETMLFAKIKCECFIPVAERRFIKKSIDKAALDASAASNPQTEAESRAQVDFLNIKLQEKLFPKSYKVLVLPGVSLQGLLQYSYTGQKWSFSLGTEVWFQAREEFLSTLAADLEISKAQQRSAFQNRIWCQAIKQSKYKQGWSYTFSLAVTPFRYEVGRSISCGFSCSCTF